MARPYNKKTVRQAVEYCEMMASNPSIGAGWVAMFLGIRFTSTPYNLAHNARMAAWVALGQPIPLDESALSLEAAALIREGWQKGDEAHKRIPHIGDLAHVVDENCPDNRAYLVPTPVAPPIPMVWSAEQKAFVPQPPVTDQPEQLELFDQPRVIPEDFIDENVAFAEKMESEIEAAHQAMGKKEEELDTYGYGGPPSEDTDAADPDAFERAPGTSEKGDC